jgi:hypothetical protein
MPVSPKRHYCNEFGAHGERRAKAILEQHGYSVEYYGGSNGFDFVVNERVTLDVKTATCGGPGGRRGYTWQFSLSKHNVHYQEDIVLLLCFDDPGDDDPIAVFVIPGKETWDLRKINITSRDPRDYKGKWARYRDDWSALDKAIQTKDVFKEKVEDIPF